eukprot:TRINITY_DN11412_c0_g1_i1.p1 TRINITY_DN11412_c0_g1~~TRINITY_DN11412_c0_g1_i1.p1  ORF type:complete len:663 (-),score=127.20 TRINITY_DN11412_c0_g1_i1:157-2145(-)
MDADKLAGEARVKMYKSLYSFKATYASALSFKEGEVFVELSGGKSDKNWYFVASPDGQSGYIPRNYMSEISLSSAETYAHVNEVLTNLNNSSTVSTADKNEVGEKLEEIKRSFSDSLVSIQCPSSAYGLRSKGSKDSLTSIRSSKKRAAPQPPIRKPQERSSSEGSEQRSETSQSPRNSPRPSNSSMDTTTTNETIPEDTESSRSPSNLKLPKTYNYFDAQKLIRTMSQVSQTSAASNNDLASQEVVTVTYQHPPESCHSKALELVELVRDSTNISHEASQTLLKSILESLVASHKDLNVLVPSLQNEFKHQLFSNETDIQSSHDFTDLANLFDELTKMKEDDQQRNWMLYEDEAIIMKNLSRVCQTLQNASQDICRHVLSRYKYSYVQNLVEYYQMETRWSIRKILIETFTLMCSLDKAIISLMLISVLPLEVAQDMFENSEEVERLKHSSVILNILFSQGEAVPVHYVEKQLGSSLVTFLLNKIENPPELDTQEETADSFMGLLASYNLQFDQPSDNIVLHCLAKSTNAKIFTEKLLLLLNREDDPAEIIGPRSGINSIHKLVLDVFSSDDCISHFYTNDLMVLIDILARQLSDLGPGMQRYTYLEMAHLVLVRSGYDEHLHRLSDLKVCLQRIQKEEGDTIDKTKVNEICNTFTCFQIN